MNELRRRVFAVGLIVFLLAVPGGFTGMADTPPESLLLLDDFTNANGVSTHGTAWQSLTDRVMGGRSDMRAEIVQEADSRFLRMTGRVSLENNGGFIQVRLPLRDGEELLDARDYRGIELDVRGSAGNYFVHVRTSQNVLPWSYYAAPLPVSEQWQTVRIPFDEFSGSSMFRRGTPNLRRLQSIAIVAGTTAFEADIAVRRIGLYR